MNRTAIQILRQLATGPKDFWQLILKQDSSIKEFVEELKRLQNGKLIKKEGSVFKLIPGKEERKIHKYLESFCRTCQNGIDPDRIKNFKERFEKLSIGRPLPREDYDQGFMRKIDTLKRALFMYERGDVEEKDIFILGDDDLLSLALGLMGLARSITVVEIDKRITDFIKKRAREERIPTIQIVNYNVLEPLPESFCERYDTFVTDPVETSAGLKVFLERCIQTLKKTGSSGYFGLTHLEASLKKWYEIERFLLNCNFVITDILRDFSFYPEDDNRWERFYQTYRVSREMPHLGLPGVDWYRSSFIRIEAVDSISLPSLTFPRSFSELYLDEETWATPHPSIKN